MRSSQPFFKRYNLMKNWMYGELSQEAGFTWQLIIELGFHPTVSAIKSVQNVFVEQKVLHHNLKCYRKLLLHEITGNCIL